MGHKLIPTALLPGNFSRHAFATRLDFNSHFPAGNGSGTVSGNRFFAPVKVLITRRGSRIRGSSIVQFTTGHTSAEEHHARSEGTKRSREFYTEALGFAVRVNGDDFSSVLTANGVEIELHAPHQGHDHTVASKGTQLSLEVDDVDKWHATTSARGVEFSQGPKKMPWGTREAYLRDPDGYLISVVPEAPTVSFDHD